MPIITIDGSQWKTSEDFYDAVLAALQAPSWHGRNLDALNDSLFGGDVNTLKPPFELHIVGVRQMSEASRKLVDGLREIIASHGDQQDILLTIES